MKPAPSSGPRRVLIALIVTVALLVVPAALAATSAGRQRRSNAIAGEATNIYTVGVDGTGLRRLTRAPDDLRYDSPAWSRSGRWIAFSGPPCDDCPELIYLIDLARGGVVERIPRTVPGAARPSWGPADRSLTFVGGLTNSVYTISRQGTGQRRLTPGLIAHDQSAWSPDGRRIIYTSQQPNGRWDVFVMRSDGSEKRNLTGTPGSEEQPAWSHDGRMIAFARQIGGKWAIFVMPAGGGRARRLTPLAENSQQPAWSPDDRQIAFTKVATGGSSVIIMRFDGTGRRRLRTGVGPASAPSWSPDSRRIAFARTG